MYILKHKEKGKIYLSVFNDVHDDTDIDYNTTCSIYTKSSLYTCSHTIRGYMDKCQGRRQLVCLGSKAKI